MAISDFESFDDLLDFEEARNVTIAQSAGTAPSEIRKIKECAIQSHKPSRPFGTHEKTAESKPRILRRLGRR
jgi:hypothetical protein